MYYLFMTRNNETFCYGSYSKYDGASDKQQRMRFQYRYAQFEIIKRN